MASLRVSGPVACRGKRPKIRATILSNEDLPLISNGRQREREKESQSNQLSFFFFFLLNASPHHRIIKSEVHFFPNPPPTSVRLTERERELIDCCNTLVYFNSQHIHSKLAVTQLKIFIKT